MGYYMWFVLKSQLLVWTMNFTIFFLLFNYLCSYLLVSSFVKLIFFLLASSFIYFPFFKCDFNIFSGKLTVIFAFLFVTSCV